MAFDGIDDLEEEDEDELDLQEAARKARRDSLLSSSRLGDGLVQLEKLYHEYEDSDEEPNLDEDTLEDLYDLLSEEVPRCPDVAQVVWAIKALEELGLEDEDLFEEFSAIIKERKNEMEPQALFDVTRSFGALFWADEELMSGLADMCRKHLPAFTQKEICQLSVSLNRMGLTDNSRNAGLVFEMLKRDINLPIVKDQMVKTLSRSGKYYEDASAEARMLVEGMPNMDQRYKKQLTTLMDHELEETKKWEIEEYERRRELQEEGFTDEDFAEIFAEEDRARRGLPGGSGTETGIPMLRNRGDEVSLEQ